jgi:hypothetical protein
MQFFTLSISTLGRKQWMSRDAHDRSKLELCDVSSASQQCPRLRTLRSEDDAVESSECTGSEVAILRLGVSHSQARSFLALT